MYVSFNLICIHNPPVALHFFCSRHIGCPSAIDQHHDMSKHGINREAMISSQAINLNVMYVCMCECMCVMYVCGVSVCE